MKRVIQTGLLASLLASIGCMTPSGEKSYQADEPPPVARSSPERNRPEASTSTAPKPETMGRRLSADEISDDNVLESVRRLDGELKDARRSAMNSRDR